MSKLEELIQELCPDGVEYKTLGEIAVDIYRVISQISFAKSFTILMCQ